MVKEDFSKRITGMRIRSHITEEAVIAAGGWDIIDTIIDYNLQYTHGDLVYKTIIDAIENQLGVKECEVLSKSRKGNIMRARSILSAIMYSYTILSIPAIGKKIGLDHSSVIHHRDLMSDELLSKFNPQLYREYVSCLEEFTAAIRWKTESPLKIKERLKSRIKELQSIINNIERAERMPFFSIVENLKNNPKHFNQNF